MQRVACALRAHSPPNSTDAWIALQYGPRMRNYWLVASACALVIGSTACGNGCSSLGPTPGGFPSAERVPNAAQVRISQSGFSAITADPAALVGGLLGGGGLSFDVPANCGGSTPVCCPNGTPVSPCGPLQVDVVAQPGDAPRMVIAPVAGQSRLDVTMRARLKTAMDIPVKILGSNCGIKIDTAPGANPDIKIDVPVSFTPDAQAGTTRVVAGDAALSQLTTDDVKLTGSLVCQAANLGLGFILDQVKGTFQDAIRDSINQQTCKACPSGNVAECGPFASACTNNVCTKADNSCVQELGIAGRLGASAFASISPGTQGAMDIYDVAGGYATTDNGGLALGFLGGALPAGAPRDRCGPSAAKPPRVAIPQSAFFAGNTRPDTGRPFGLAFGLHKSQLDQIFYSLYEGGALCLTITTDTSAQLNTDTLALVARSLSDIANKTGKVAIGLRPQSVPRQTLGRNLFVDNNGTATLQEPLLDINFDKLEMDFFAQIEDQYIRLFTVVTDLHLPLGMQVNAMGQLQPVLGDLQQAFTNISVKNSEALKETPAQIAAVIPTLLGLALPGLAGGLSPVDVPGIGGVSIKVTDLTAVDNKAFLALFADLVPGAMPRVRVAPVASVIAADLPNTLQLAEGHASDSARLPAVTLALGTAQDASLDVKTLGTATAARGYEWSYRVDAGLWSPWSKSQQPTLRDPLLGVPGAHQIEVIARVTGEPLTASLTPVRLVVTNDSAALSDLARRGEFHGQASGGGCSCESGASRGAPWLAALVAMCLFGGRWLRRGLARLRLQPTLLVSAGFVVVASTQQGCDCNSAPCGDKACLAGELSPGELGRYNAVASDGTRTVATTYDAVRGDLVLVELTASTPSFHVVDGVPALTPTYEPSSYRGGVEDSGADVGKWTSVAIAKGKVVIAYQDVETKALKIAIEQGKHEFAISTVEEQVGVELGQFASLAVDGDGRPAIAYLATNVPGAAGALTTELRFARAARANPGAGDWTISRIATAPASCVNACADGQACVVALDNPNAQVCVTPTADCGTTCATDQTCVAGACRATFADTPVQDLPTGTGLFVNLVRFDDGRYAAVYYDRVRTALVMAVESAVGSNAFAEVVLDDAGDRGMWASAAVAQGTVHVAYQDALSDTVYYQSTSGAPGTPELVDDGVRAGDRTHPVGASSTVTVVNGSPVVAYQDAMTSDVVLARKAGNAWQHETLASGTPLDGFYVAGAGATLVWGTIDHTTEPLMNLKVSTVP